jgi:hypothetical protein
LVNVEIMLQGKEQIREGQTLQIIGWLTIAATAIEDVATGGTGVADDWATVAGGLSSIAQGRTLESTGRETLANGVVSGNTKDADDNCAGRVKGIYSQLDDGHSPKVKTVGSEDELKELYSQFADGGSFSDRKGYDGVGIGLSDGTWIGYREDSDSGGATIDINYSDGSGNYKVHIEYDSEY